MRQIIIALYVVILLPIFGVFAQDEVVLVPFEDDTYSIQGIVPEGWDEFSSGIYLSPDNLQTLVALQAAPATPEILLDALLPQFGLDAPPEPLETLETEFLSWTLYKIEVSTAGVEVVVDLGLADGGNVTYLSLLQAPTAEYPALHESVFLPMVEAYAPLEIETAYLAEDITFPNADITLAGTISLPDGEGPFPAIVLISGSGKQDRDESLLPSAEIKPFRLLADYLTAEGYVVLRFDDRGIGGSTGNIDSTLQENASDVASAIDYLLTRAEVDPEKIGLLGHSEGGTISAMLGAENPNIAFIISMAGTSVNGEDVLYLQNARLMEAEGATEEQVASQMVFLEALFMALEENDSATIETITLEQLRNSLTSLSEEELATLGDVDTFIETQVETLLTQYDSAWFRSFLDYDPSADWANITVPVLAIFGELDVQVDAEQNGTALESALAAAGNTDYTIVTIEGANHLFQAAETGALSEYGTLEQTFTPEFLPTIGDWLAERFGDQ